MCDKAKVPEAAQIVVGHRYDDLTLVLSPEETLNRIDHPELSLAHIYAALTYYHAHREEIEADLAAEETVLGVRVTRLIVGFVVYPSIILSKELASSPTP